MSIDLFRILAVFGRSGGPAAGGVDAAKARRDARQAAVAEYHRLQEEEFYRELPQLKAAAAERRQRFEAFMRKRGFEP